MLVTTAQLSNHLNDSAWIVFDCRHDLADHAKGARAFREGHIPGAHFAPVETALSGAKTGRNGRHPLPAPQAFADFLGQHGVAENTMVVAYDDVGGQYAARLWWMARWIGLTRVALLDGGFSKWVANGGVLATEAPQQQAVALRARPDSAMVWSADEVARRLCEPASALIDARTGERFRGGFSKPTSTPTWRFVRRRNCAGSLPRCWRAVRRKTSVTNAARA
jgi:thiosulfate/3-mercaptopyruvate sulfurtransferase